MKLFSEKKLTEKAIQNYKESPDEHCLNWHRNCDVFPPIRYFYLYKADYKTRKLSYRKLFEFFPILFFHDKCGRSSSCYATFPSPLC